MFLLNYVIDPVSEEKLIEVDISSEFQELGLHSESVEMSRGRAGAGDSVAADTVVADLPFNVEFLDFMDTAPGAGAVPAAVSVQSVPRKSVIQKVSRLVPAVPGEGAEEAAGTRALPTTLLPSVQLALKRTHQKGS